MRPVRGNLARPPAFDVSSFGLRLLLLRAQEALSLKTECLADEAVGRSIAFQRCPSPVDRRGWYRQRLEQYGCCGGNQIPPDNGADVSRNNVDTSRACRV